MGNTVFWVGLTLIVAGAAGLPSLYDNMGWNMSPQLGAVLRVAFWASILGGLFVVVYGVGDWLVRLRKEWRLDIRLYRRTRPHPDLWLRQISGFDVQRPSWAMRVTDYQVDMTGLGETPPWVDFQVTVFNGGVHSVRVIEVSGQICYTDDQGTMILIDPAPTLVFQPSSAQRGNEFVLALRQGVTPTVQAALLRDNPRGGMNVLRGFSLSNIRLRLKPEPSDNANARTVLEQPFRDTVPNGQPFRVVGR